MTSYRRMRRQARRVHRSGVQPMMLISSGDQFPEPAGVLILRVTWRYRSELAPAYLASAIVGASWWLHASHPHWWPFFVGIAAVAAAALAVFGAIVGLSVLMERLYAATTTAAIGAWVAAATAQGPFVMPLPQALVMGGLVLSVPGGHTGAAVPRSVSSASSKPGPEIARAVGLAGSQIMSAVVDVWGWRARLRLARGQTIADLTAKIPAIESGLGTFRGAVRVHPTPDDLANRCELRVLDMDPHADAVPWPGPSVTTITEPIDLGPFEDAAPCRVLFLRRHALGGGTTGSGKSGWLNVLMGNLVACRDVVIWAIDMKKGMELGPWQECIGRLATTPEQATALLRDAVAILQARAELLAASGRRVWEPSEDMPALVIVIDEYAELAEDAPEAARYTDSIARLGRAAAVTMIAATQRPAQKVMGQGTVRSQMDIRTCFRVRERRDVDLILGQGMLSVGWHAHTLNVPGKFLISAPGHDIPRRGRAYLLTDEAVRATAERYAASRPTLDEISQRVLTDRPSVGPSPEATGESAGEGDPDAILWAALSFAPEDGIPVADLVAATGMSHRWVNYRLRALADSGEAIQLKRGMWRAIAPEGDTP
jgi:hypothetical protein